MDHGIGQEVFFHIVQGNLQLIGSVDHVVVRDDITIRRDNDTRGKTMFGLQNQGMLKSTKDRLDRQAQRDGKIEFYEKQKQNLKNTEAQTVEEIAKKLEMFHSYEDEIKAAKQEYNSSQMLHVLDEAQERAEKIAKAAEKNKPKTPEERRKDALDEAAGKDEDKGELSEIMDDLSEKTDESAEKMAESAEKTAESADEMSDTIQAGGDINSVKQSLTDTDIENEQNYKHFNMLI